MRTGSLHGRVVDLDRLRDGKTPMVILCPCCERYKPEERFYKKLGVCAICLQKRPVLRWRRFRG